MAIIPYDFRDKYVCIMGLGYVGLTLATVMAETGFIVLGVEIKPNLVKQIQKGKPHFYEPSLKDRLKQVVESGKLQCFQKIPCDYAGTVFIITVGTPLDASGKARLDMVENVSREVASVLKDKDLVILRSTLKPGTTRNIVMPILQSSGANFDLAFCPERTLEGKALQELRQLPQIIGEATPGASVRASQLFQFITPTTVRVTDAETAEMIKLIDNAQRDMLFAYANEIARLCDAFGISAREVIEAGKLGYPRTNLPMPGPVGGPCLEKDSYILAEKMLEIGIRPEITLAARNINERQPEEIIAYLKKLSVNISGFPEHPVITLMGIAFKGHPATDDLRGSMAKPIFKALQKYFPESEYRGFDAVVPEKQIKKLGLKPYTNLEQAILGSNLVLILNNHSVFSTMPVEKLACKLARPGLIYDFWNNFIAEDLQLPPGTGYMALGSHNRALLLYEKIIAR
ncbi:MAG: nucleotide sugar dehydrogenase [Syntrophomonas sp.]